MRWKPLAQAFRSVTDNPVVARECFSHLRDGKMIGGLAVFLSIHAFVAFAMILAWRGDRDPGFGRTMFVVLTCLQMADLFLILPAFAATSICGEKERQTYDLLSLSRLHSWEILAGKWLALILYTLLFNAACAPIVSLVFLVGGVSLKELFWSQIGLMLTAILLSIVCLHVSSRYDSSKKAVSIAYVASSLYGIIVTSIMGAGLSSYYAQGNFWHQWFPGQVLGSTWVALYASCCYGYLALLGFFFSISSNRLKGFGENTSTSLRVQFVAYALVTPFLFMALSKLAGGLHLASCETYLMFQSAVLPLLGISFCLEDPLIRLKREVPWRQWQGRKRLLSWFMPGSRTGICLTGLLTFLSLTLVPIATCTQDLNTLTATVESLGCGLAFNLATFTFAFFLATTIPSLKARKVILCAIAIAVAFISSIFLYLDFLLEGVIATSAAAVLPVYSMVFLNPFACMLMAGTQRGAITSYWGLSLFGERISLSLFSCLVYSTLFVVFFFLSRRSWRKWQKAHPELSHA